MLENERDEFLHEIARIATVDLELRSMLQRVTEILSAHFGWEFVACMTVDSDRRIFVCEALTSAIPTKIHPGYSRGLDTGIVGEVALKTAPVIVDDVSTYSRYVETAAGVRSELCVPVIHRDELVAIINAESTSLGVFDGQLEKLMEVAAQLSGPITSALIHQDLLRRASLMKMMSEISRVALELGDLQEVLCRIVTIVDRSMEVTSTQVALLDSSGSGFHLAAVAGGKSDRYPLGSIWPTTFGIVGRCIREGTTQLVLDVENDPDYVSFHDEISSALVVPIRFQGTLLGAVNVECSSTDALRSEYQLVFATLADQIAGIVNLAALNDRISRLTAELDESNRKLRNALHRVDPSE